MDICIDFDGTCVTHEFPNVGQDIGAAPVLRELVANGHNLILFTMRSDKHDNTGFSEEIPEIHNGNFLTDAVNWFKKNDIPLYGIQSNPTQKEWTTSPKAYGQLYIDDAALGCPLISGIDGSATSDRPFVNWSAVRIMLIMKGILRDVEIEVLGNIHEPTGGK